MESALDLISNCSDYDDMISMLYKTNSKTGKTCYNLGFDGTTYPLQKLMLELYLSENKSPEEIQPIVYSDKI